MPSLNNLADYGRIFKAVTDIHATLSKTPLRPFLSSPTQMATSVFRAATSAKNFNDAITKASNQINTMIQNAAKQAGLPVEQFSQLSSQIQNSMSDAMKQVGSAAPN